MLAAVPQHDGGADRRLDDQVVRLVARQAEQDAGVRHGLDQEVEVGRPRTRQGRGGVLLGLGQPQGLADTVEDVLGVCEVLLGGVGAAGDHGHGLVDEGRRVGHDAHDGRPGGEAGLDETGGDARGGGDHEPVGRGVRGQLVQQGGHVLRLDGQDQDVGALGGVRVADGLHAVPGPQGLGALGAADGREQVGGGTPGPEHAAEQGLTDLPGAEDGDLVGHERAHSLASRWWTGRPHPRISGERR